jgi:hypothetical protein
MKALILQAWVLAAQLFDRIPAKTGLIITIPPPTGGLFIIVFSSGFGFSLLS